MMYGEFFPEISRIDQFIEAKLSSKMGSSGWISDVQSLRRVRSWSISPTSLSSLVGSEL